MHVLSLLFLALLTNAEVTIYTQIAFGTETPTTTTKAWPTLTNAAAYDPVVLTPPAAPNPAVGGASVVQLVTGGMNNMSLPVPPGFVGFSVELSVCDQVRKYLSYFRGDLISKCVQLDPMGELSQSTRRRMLIRPLAHISTRNF